MEKQPYKASHSSLLGYCFLATLGELLPRLSLTPLPLDCSSPIPLGSFNADPGNTEIRSSVMKLHYQEVWEVLS